MKSPSHSKRASTMKNHLVLLPIHSFMNFVLHRVCSRLCWNCFEWFRCIIDPIFLFEYKERLAYLHRGILWNSGFQTTYHTCVKKVKIWRFSLFIHIFLPIISLCTSYTLNYSKLNVRVCARIFLNWVETAQRARCFNLV